MSSNFDIEYEKLVLAAFRRFSDAIIADRKEEILSPPPLTQMGISCKKLKFALAAATGQSPTKVS